MPGPAGPLSKFQATVIRSAFLAYAGEIINTALWKVWVCNDEACGNPHPTEKQDCRLIQRMIEAAVWYLDRAGDDEAEFADEDNRGTFRGESIVMPLFRGGY
jgi:hypothetical protein